MKFFSLLYILFLSSTLYAQKTLQEIRVEENIFILKIIAIIVLLLIAMPFVLRKLRSISKVPIHHDSVPVVEVEEPKSSMEAVAEVEDPMVVALDTLFVKHDISDDRREKLTPLYRRYLELEMGKVEIKTGSFDFNDALDAVLSRIHGLDGIRNFEMVFDIDANVPSKMIGDAERMDDILFYLIQNVVLKSSSYLVKLKIRRLNLGDGALHLEFYIPYNKDNYEEEKSDIFTPFVGGATEAGLELYLAKEYALLMHGDIVLDVNGENDSVFVANLKLYMPNPSEMRHYRLPSRKMVGHAVLIVDDHNESALAVQKMFEYFKNEVDVLSSKELFSALEMLEDYDIVVLQERFFSKHLIAKLEEIKSKRMIKVVSLNKNEAFEHTDPVIIAMLDSELSKPATVQKVFDLLVFLYQEKH